MSTRLKPLLPLDPTLRQRAISAATRLTTEFTKGGQYCVPVGKYAQEVCKLFHIPLLPKESPIAVAVKKLEEWRAQVNFRTVTDADIEAVLPQLESLVKTIRLAISFSMPLTSSKTITCFSLNEFTRGEDEFYKLSR